MNETRDREARIGCCAGADGAGAECGEPRRYEGLEEATEILKALADETRLAIVRQLLERDEMCACEFEACCRLAQPTVSHHLRVLREAGIVRADRRGQWVYYRLMRARLKLLAPWLP